MIHPGQRKGRIRLLAAVFILCTAAALYGKGANDSFLSSADELIENKEYDQALQILTDYLKNNPDHFGEAQKRLQKIIQLRERYNQIAGELLDVLEDDPENNEKILSLVDLLLTIESPHNPSTRRFLDQIRYLAEFNVNRNRLERILAEARVQLGLNNFHGAMATYASGLDIYRDDYFRSGFGQNAEDTASKGLENIGKNIREFSELAGPFSRAAQTMAGSMGTTILPRPEELRAAYSGLLPYINELVVLIDGFFTVRKSFDDQLVILQKEFDIQGDRSFLSFAGRLVTGPAGQQEGMTGVLERFWGNNIQQIDDLLMTFVNRSYGAGYNALIGRDYTGALTTFDASSQYISIALDHLRNWNSFLAARDSKTNVILDEDVCEEKTGNYLRFQSMNIALGYLRRIGNFGNQSTVLENPNLPTLSSWQQGRLNTQSAVSQEQNTRRSYREMINEISVLEDKIGTDIETILGYVNMLADVSGGVGMPQSYISDTRNMLENLGIQFRRLELNSIVRQYTVANGDVENRVLAREKDFIEASTLIDGISQDMEGAGVYTAYFPSEGLAILTRISGNLEPDIREARTLLSQYSAEPQNVLEASAISPLHVSAQDLLNRLLSLQSRTSATMAIARTRIDRAASLRYEGDRQFQAAQAALGRNDFNAARTFLYRATEQYNASLAVQESVSLRSTWDTQLVGLGADIVRIENEVVVRDVRNMVTNARTGYYAGNMEQAEELLVRAQNRWRVTNITENQEVEYWLRLVRGALSLQSGRTIVPTAPLYAEMSQLLSDAKGNYDQGVRLLNAGQRREGLARFNDAMGKTREVRLMFPMNHDARMLELRIEQQTDQAVFNAAFRQRLNEAVAGTKQRNPESFAELQDLAEINPRYPGIQGILTQAEIDMGFRPPPPDPRDLARSTELARSAQTVINARDSIRFEAAETWLEDAIRLNPNNTQAQMLMDQLQILMTGSGTIVIDSHSMDRYNAALQEYLRGNFLSANAIVLQLLQNPENQKSTMIQDLKRRIDAVL